MSNDESVKTLNDMPDDIVVSLAICYARLMNLYLCQTEGFFHFLTPHQFDKYMDDESTPEDGEDTFIFSHVEGSNKAIAEKARIWANDLYGDSDHRPMMWHIMEAVQAIDTTLRDVLETLAGGDEKEVKIWQPSTKIII